MAYFTNKDTKSPEKNKKIDPNNPFAFDIDEQGHSSQSRQRVYEFDHSMINNGEHCQLGICNQLDILPCKCDFCNKTFCRQHSHPEQHNCDEYVADLTTSPLCEICNEYIKVSPNSVKTRTQYNKVISEHIESNCTRHTFKRTDDERARLKAALLCSAPFCNNHTSSGKKLSTIICKDCNQQVCLSHRLGDYHDCPKLTMDKIKHEAENVKKEKMKSDLLNKMYGKIDPSDNTTTTTNSTTERLRQVQKSVHERAREQCKNPFLLNRQESIKAKLEAQSLKKNASSNSTENGKDGTSSPGTTVNEEDIFVPKTVTTIPTRGILVQHEQCTPLNVKTALMQCKPKTKNPANNTIPTQNKVYCVVYFPHTVIPATQVTSTTNHKNNNNNTKKLGKDDGSSSTNNSNNNSTNNSTTNSTNNSDDDDDINNHIPFSTQDTLLTFNQSNFNTSLVLLKESDPNNSLEYINTIIPQCFNNDAKLLSIVQNNAKLKTPLYVSFDMNWTIKQCIDEIARYVQLPLYDNAVKLNNGKVVYTLSMLSFPIANFHLNLTLADIIKQYEFDFNLETEMLQEEMEISQNNHNNHKKSATDRINTTFLPLHLSFGWFIDTNTAAK